MKTNQNFIIKSLEKLYLYKTPKSIIDLINKDSIIKNPPYDVKK